MAPTPKKFKQYDQEAMSMAVSAVKEKRMTLKQAAVEFNVPMSTVWDKVTGRVPLVPKRRTVLTAEEENKIKDMIITSSRRGNGKTKQQLQRIIQKVLNTEGRVTIFRDNKPGYTWPNAFLNRHPEIATRKAMILSDHRARVSEQNIRDWFQEVKNNLALDTIDVTKVDPRCIFNADESGFPLYSQGEVILTETCNKHVYKVGTDNRKQITVLSCASAAGDLLPPTIVYPGKRWTHHQWEDFPESSFALTKNGWMDSETWLKWLKETFVPAVESQVKFHGVPEELESSMPWSLNSQSDPEEELTKTPEDNEQSLPWSLISQSREQTNEASEDGEQLLSACRRTEVSFAATSTPSSSPPKKYQPSPDIAMYLDQLIDVIIAAKWTAADMFWVRRRHIMNIPPKDGEEKYSAYIALYDKIVPPMTFDNLPVPQGWTEKLKATSRIQGPKYISGKAYKLFQEEKHNSAKSKKKEAREKSKEAMEMKKQVDQKKEVVQKKKRWSRKRKRWRRKRKR
ncbi:tigger transposable element-derived protein 6-like protein [Elysia marginata]|uniref:Tigger transposable element-derived protein 6-like protein n=1 Tax=Elysia marginata TaxID=1093978 RepID=A0AAV4HD13_9GAST|nr:tigger transposable element-derived protein 6-like protein [Elysia marginata]